MNAADNDQPAHSVRPRTRPARVAGIVGLTAAAVGIGLGTAALIRPPPSTAPAQQNLREVTVSPSAAAIPLSDAEIFALLDRGPDYGSLADPRRLASCLNGLAYPAATRVLGAEPIDIDDHPGVLLVLPGDKPDTVVALAVAPNCSSMSTGLLADTTVSRP
jgi:hypothetical protein